MTNSSCPSGQGFDSASAKAFEVTKVVVTAARTNSNINGRIFVSTAANADASTGMIQCGNTVTASSAGEKYTFVCDIPGRYIFVMGFVNAQGSLVLLKVDVEVAGVFFNGGVASQSSTYADKEARLALVTGSAAYSHTTSENQPNSWWRLDTGINF